MAPFIDLMRANISNTLKISTNDVSIKAKTNEGMDSTGKEEAIQAYAIILIDKI